MLITHGAVPRQNAAEWICLRQLVGRAAVRKWLWMVMPWSWAAQRGKGEPETSLPFFSACWSHFLLGSGSSAAKGAVDSKAITQKEGRWWRLLQCICYRACVSKTSINLSQILNHGVVYPLSHPWNSYFQTESRHFKDRQKLTMTHCFRTP